MHTPEVGIGHLPRTVDDAAHDSNGHTGQVPCLGPDLLSHLQARPGGTGAAFHLMPGADHVCVAARHLMPCTEPDCVAG